MFSLSTLDTGPIKIVESRHGKFAVLESDRCGIGALLQYYGEFCEHEIRLLCALIGRDGFMIEVGCNIGTHTVPIARHLTSRGRLVAYEAQPMIAALLRLNLSLNGFTQVDMRVRAAGAEAGYCKMPVVDYTQTTNVGSVSLLRGELSDASIQIEPLDSLERSRPVDLIKIDVEGMEIDVLRGAESIIKHDRPIIYFEHEMNTEGELLKPIIFLDDKNYELFWDIKYLHDECNFHGRTTPFFGDIGSASNVLAIPAERVAQLAGILAGMKIVPITDPTNSPAPVAP